MRHLYPLFFLFFLMPVFSFAQGNYKPGYVVTLNGDTVKGFIKNETWSKNPQTFSFKNNLADTLAVSAKSYSMNDAATVVISGIEIYKRFTLQISRDETTESRLSVGIDKKYITSTIFLKVVNRGKYITLYEYRDDIKDRYFIDENNGKPVELALNVYLSTSSSTEPIREDTYKRQLQGLATKYQAGNQDLIAEIQGSDYTKADLENAVFKINGSDNATTFSSTRKFRSRPFAGIGINMIRIHNYDPGDFGVPNNANTYNAQPSPAAEINFGEDVFFSQSKRSPIFRMEFHFIENAGSNITGGQDDNLLEKYNLYYITLNPNILFSIYSSDNLDIHIGAGASMVVYGHGNTTFSANNNELLMPVYGYGNFTLTTSANAVINKKIGFYAGYDPISTIGQRINTLSTFHLGINFLFGDSK